MSFSQCRDTLIIYADGGPALSAIDGRHYMIRTNIHCRQDVRISWQKAKKKIKQNSREKKTENFKWKQGRNNNENYRIARQFRGWRGVVGFQVTFVCAGRKERGEHCQRERESEYLRFWSALLGLQGNCIAELQAESAAAAATATAAAASLCQLESCGSNKQKKSNRNKELPATSYKRPAEVSTNCSRCPGYGRDSPAPAIHQPGQPTWPTASSWPARLLAIRAAWIAARQSG